MSAKVNAIFAGGYLWIGEEFEPYMIKADLNGKIIEIFETVVDGTLIKSPDHFSVVAPNTPTDLVAFQLRRSQGYEGMAASVDGTKLYPLLEGALWNETTKSYEAVDGKQYLRPFLRTVALWQCRCQNGSPRSFLQPGTAILMFRRFRLRNCYVPDNEAESNLV